MSCYPTTEESIECIHGSDETCMKYRVSSVHYKLLKLGYERKFQRNIETFLIQLSLVIENIELVGGDFSFTNFNNIILSIRDMTCWNFNVIYWLICQ